MGPLVEMARLAGETTEDDAAATRNGMIQLLQEQALDLNTVSHLLHTLARVTSSPPSPLPLP